MPVSILNFSYFLESFNQNTSAISENKARRNRLCSHYILAVCLWRCAALALHQSLGVVTWTAGEWWSFPTQHVPIAVAMKTCLCSSWGRGEIWDCSVKKHHLAVKSHKTLFLLLAWVLCKQTLEGYGSLEPPCSSRHPARHPLINAAAVCLECKREVSRTGALRQLSLRVHMQKAERKGSIGRDRISKSRMDGSGGACNW